MFIDTHTHLTFPDFQAEMDGIINRALQAGVDKFIVPSIDLKSSRDAVRLAEKYSPVFAAIGVHPQESQQFNPSLLDEFDRMAQHPKVVAIGELGLDYYRDYAPHAVQKEILELFLKLASEVSLPVILHNREAFVDLISILKQKSYKNLRGVFHCFSEDEHRGREVLDMGFVISFTGNITFKKSNSARVARLLPLKKQLLETDAPFMAPVPNRSKQNEPAFIPYIAGKQAELHEVSVEKTAQVTTALAEQIFPKLNK